MSAATRGMPEHTYPAEADGSRALPIMPRPWRRFVTRAAAAPRSATVAATRWWPPSGASIPISRRSGSTTGARRAGSTSARAASRRARSPRRAERVTDPSLARFRAVVERALAHFETRRQEINDLNVFPVADGDTGDNMALTLRAVLAELDRLSDGRALDEIGRDEIVDSVARAALLGARGNSGVILSQLIRGAAEELISRPGELVDPVLVGAAMARAADRAYDSVRDPAEGTILTVVREMAHRVASELAHMDEPRLTQSDAERQDALIADVLERALDAGQQSVRRGPDLLPILREAGVVDAGGHGLPVLFAGVLAALRGP